MGGLAYCPSLANSGQMQRGSGQSPHCSLLIFFQGKYLAARNTRSFEILVLTCEIPSPSQFFIFPLCDQLVSQTAPIFRSVLLAKEFHLKEK